MKQSLKQREQRASRASDPRKSAELQIHSVFMGPLERASPRGTLVFKGSAAPHYTPTGLDELSFRLEVTGSVREIEKLLHGDARFEVSEAQP